MLEGRQEPAEDQARSGGRQKLSLRSPGRWLAEMACRWWWLAADPIRVLGFGLKNRMRTDRWEPCGEWTARWSARIAPCGERDQITTSPLIIAKDIENARVNNDKGLFPIFGSFPSRKAKTGSSPRATPGLVFPNNRMPAQERRCRQAGVQKYCCRPQCPHWAGVDITGRRIGQVEAWSAGPSRQRWWCGVVLLSAVDLAPLVSVEKLETA